MALRFSHLAAGTYRLEVHRTGFRANDPLSAYIDMGMPKAFLPDQLRKMQALTSDRPETTRTVRIGAGGDFSLRVPMRTNDVVLVTLEAERPATATKAPRR